MSELATIMNTSYAAALGAGVLIVGGLINPRTRAFALIVAGFALASGAFGFWFGRPYESLRTGAFFFAAGSFAGFLWAWVQWMIWGPIIKHRQDGWN